MTTRPVILLDLDQTLVDLHTRLCEHINITGEPSMRAAPEAAIQHALNNPTEGTSK